MTDHSRQAEPGARFVWHDEWGVRHEAKADDKGIVRLKAAEAPGFDASYGLPAVADKPAAPAKEG